MSRWEGFKEWVSDSFRYHPVYTVSFGIVCFASGFILG